MRDDKRRRLESKGWKIGSAADFLELTPVEAAFVEVKVALSRWLKIVRKDRSLTQHDLAEIVHSSQSRVAKMEAGDPSVSLDLLVRGLFALGVTGKDVGRIIAGEPPRIRAAMESKRRGAETDSPAPGRGRRASQTRSRAA